jgi:GxxExxY protein
MFGSEKIGINYLDFLIEDKIVLELKKGDYFNRATIKQVNQYLKTTKLKLALIAVFTSRGVKVKRLVNIK